MIFLDLIKPNTKGWEKKITFGQDDTWIGDDPNSHRIAPSLEMMEIESKWRGKRKRDRIQRRQRVEGRKVRTKGDQGNSQRREKTFINNNMSKMFTSIHIYWITIEVTRKREREELGRRLDGGFLLHGISSWGRFMASLPLENLE